MQGRAPLADIDKIPDGKPDEIIINNERNGRSWLFPEHSLMN